jgi:peptidyl-prolyl cis-trans isomerase SurA
MREYEEGILLFEATKILVWDKASQDSIGLDEFHSTRKANYTWNDRAVASKYTIKAGSEDEVEKIRKDARKKPSDTVLEKYNKEEPIITVEEEVFEKGKSRMPRGLEWRAGAVSDVTVSQRSKASNFHKIEKILPPSEKTLKEARGYVIADYQDFLDKKWLEELRSTYKIETDQAVFEGLIKE